jgi:aspartate-semialdehyde dehydrogenase
VVLNHFEAVRVDIEKTIEQSETREQWRDAVRGVLLYWLGQLYDEGAGYTKDLETSVGILRRQIEQLKKYREDEP